MNDDNCHCRDDGNCWRQIARSRGHGIVVFYKIPTFPCSTWIILGSCAAPLTVCSRNTANNSVTQGWGQREEIGFCQACRQVLNLEYLSHIKSTFIGCNPQPPLSSPLEVLSGCVWSVFQWRRSLGTSQGAFCASPPPVLKKDAFIHQKTRAARVRIYWKARLLI